MPHRRRVGGGKMLRNRIPFCSSRRREMNQAMHPVRKNIRTAAFLLLVFCVVFLSFGGRRLGSVLIRHRVDRAMERWAISPALQCLEWGVWLDPEDGEWQMTRAKCFRLLGQMAQWQQSLESAEAKGIPSDWIEAEEQIGSIASGHVPDNVQGILRRFVAAGLPRDDISAAIVRGYLQSGDHERAQELLLQWETKSTAEAHVAYMWGVYREAMREREEAVKQLEQAVREQPDHELARVLLAQLYDSENLLDLALQEYVELVTRFPTNEFSQIGLASILRKLTRLNEARSILEPLVERENPSPDAMFQMAQIAFDAGEYSEVSHWFQGIDLDRIRDPGMLGMAASMHGLNGDTPRALALFRRGDAFGALPRRTQDLSTRMMLDPTDFRAAHELQQLTTRPNPPLELGQLVPWEPPATTGAADAATSGLELYAAECAICHGIQGAGDGRAAQHVFPAPRSFRAEPFHLVSTTNRVPSLQDVENVVRQGMPGTSMPAYDTLSDEQIDLLAREVLRLYGDGLRDQFTSLLAEMGETADEDEVNDFIHSRTTPEGAILVPPIGQGDTESIARGKQIYEQVCKQCHGATGCGEADVVLFDDMHRPSRPRDLVHEPFKGGHEPGAIFLRLYAGMPGTAHPAASNLSGDQLVDLVQFCCSLSNSKGPQRTLTNHQRAIYVLPSAYLSAFEH